MMIVGVLVNYVDGRILLALGFAGFGYSTLLLSHINLEHLHVVRRPAKLPQRLCRRIYLCAAHHHDHEHAPQAGNRQCRRHLQPDAEHRRLRRHCHGDHFSGARRANPPELSGANVTATNPTAMAALQGLQGEVFQEGPARSPRIGMLWRQFTAAFSNRPLCLPMRTTSACSAIFPWPACLCLPFCAPAPWQASAGLTQEHDHDREKGAHDSACSSRQVMLSPPPARFAASTSRCNGRPEKPRPERTGSKKRLDPGIGEFARQPVGTEQEKVAGSASSSKYRGSHGLASQAPW